MNVYPYLLDTIEQKGAAFLALIDPDKQSPEAARDMAQKVVAAGADGLLVGGSFLFTDHFHPTLEAVKIFKGCPVILFPGVSGASAQLSPQADAILLLSLVSGRNAEYLIGEHVRSALWIDQWGLETIPTAYVLVESGLVTSAEFLSGTKPIPRDKPEIAMVHALAAQQLGMKLVYLEAGSGALHPVPDAMIALVRSRVDIPIIVGGGIREPEIARQKVEAGARIIVIGTAIEQQPDQNLMRAFAGAIHRPIAKKESANR
jgi:phosphoglycerol geranylgeranyltransferase